MLAFATTCTVCGGPFRPGTQPVRLLDLTFHGVCAPRCQTCNAHLGEDDQSDWRYSARPVADWCGYRVEPTAYWCQTCWERGTETRFAFQVPDFKLAALAS